MVKQLCILLAFTVAFALAGPAWAGCCLTGSTSYPDYSGVLLAPIGGAECYFLFEHCNVTIYHYEPCPNGPTSVVSMVVSGFPRCSYDMIGVCVAEDYVETYYTTEQGYIDEWFKNC